LTHERFIVRKQLRLVNEYTHRSRWENINKGDFVDICHRLANLPSVAENYEEVAKRFDLIILRLQLALLYQSQQQVNLINRIGNIGRLLQKKKNIPAVNLKIETIKAVQTDEFWMSVSLKQLDKVRVDLRDLILFIDTDQKKIVYTNFEDTLNADQVKEFHLIPNYTNMQSYRDRVEIFVRKNKDYLAIHKLQNNIPITKGELILLEKLLFEGDLGTKEDYRHEYGDLPLGKFVRSLLGLDAVVAQQLFADFIQAGNLTADQITPCWSVFAIPASLATNLQFENNF